MDAGDDTTRFRILIIVAFAAFVVGIAVGRSGWGGGEPGDRAQPPHPRSLGP